MSISLKIFFRDDARRVSVSSLSFDSLVERLKKMYGDQLNTDFVIRYRDEDNDAISITSEEELAEALRVTKNENNVFRLWIEPKQAESSAEQPKFPCRPYGMWRDRAHWHQRRENASAPAQGACPRRRGAWWQRFRYGMEVNDQGKDVHRFVICDGCQAHPIIGKRFKCLDCPDFDLCETCYDKKMHAQHSFLEVSSQRPQAAASSDQPEERSDSPPSAPVQDQPLESKAESKPEEVDSPSAPVEECKPVPVPMPAPVSAPPVEPVHPAGGRFSNMLQSLEEMGFKDRQVNIAALVRFRGDLLATIQYLLSL